MLLYDAWIIEFYMCQYVCGGKSCRSCVVFPSSIVNLGAFFLCGYEGMSIFVVLYLLRELKGTFFWPMKRTGIRWFLVHNPIGFLVTKKKPWHSPIPRRKVSSWHDSNHYLFGGDLELQGCTGTLLKLLMLLLLNSRVRKVLGKEAEACYQINVVWLRWLRRCLALSSEQLHGQWITKVYCDCWIAHL